MRKVLQIAWHEFRKSVFRRRFIVVLLMPLFIMAIAVVIGFITVSAISKFEKGAVGYIDPSNTLAGAQNPTDASFTFTRFDDEAAAKQALSSGQIVGYLTLGDDFAQSGKVNLFYWKDEPDDKIEDDFQRFRNTALLAGQSDAVKNRVLSGTSFTFQTPDLAQSRNSNELPSFVVPLILTIFFIISLMGGSQYLMQAVLDEKENRTMEIVVTSVTPTQLMAGKVVGLGAVGMLQMFVWLIAAAVALAVLSPRLPFLTNIAIKPDFIVLALVLFTLQYLLLGAFMAAVGSMVTDAKQGQNYASPFTMIAMSPMFFLVAILFDPNGPIATIISLIPLMSPIALLVRYGMVSVPVWQVALALVLMALSAAGAIWLAGRIFRVGMLRFDKGVRWTEVLGNLKF